MTPTFPTLNALEWGGVFLFASSALIGLLVACYCAESAWERRIDRREARRLWDDDELDAAMRDWSRQ